MREKLQVWEVWRTQFTEFTCARCGALDGALFPRGEGPHPPLHQNCRCRRVYHHEVLIEIPLVISGEDVEELDDESKR